MTKRQSQKLLECAKNLRLQTEAATPAPPRIVDTGNRSLKSQLRYVRQVQVLDPKELLIASHHAGHLESSHSY